MLTKEEILSDLDRLRAQSPRTRHRVPAHERLRADAPARGPLRHHARARTGLPPQAPRPRLGEPLRGDARAARRRDGHPPARTHARILRPPARKGLDALASARLSLESARRAA